MKNIAIAVVVLIVLGVVLYIISPGFRKGVDTGVGGITQWTDDAIKNDPEGYYRHVEKRMKTDLAQLETSIGNLRVEVGSVSQSHAEKVKSLGEMQEMIDEFVDAKVNDTFPVTVMGKEYSDAQLKGQVDQLIAQKDAAAASVTALESTAEAGGEMVKNLLVSQEQLNTNLTILKAKREMFVAGKLTTESLEMAKSLDNLLKGNEKIIENSSVRTFAELKKAKLKQAEEEAKSKPTLFDELVKQRKAEKANPVQKTEEPAPAKERETDENAEKPIFKQS